jgi:hypothetical protein
MNQDSSQKDWFFNIEEAPVLFSLNHKGTARNVRVPHKKALVSADLETRASAETGSPSNAV